MGERRLSVYLFRLIPTRLLSRLFGRLSELPVPGTLMRRFIAWYSGKFGVIDEYVIPPGGFRTINRFFTRELAPGARPVDGSRDSVVSPVDARVDQYGAIDGGAIIQAKEIGYRLESLIPSAMAERFRDGSFMTLYLSPGDYHRIHSPLAGVITGYFAIPGALFTVQEYMVQGLPGLFCKNERLITYLETPFGPVAVCKIGAMNVGRMTLSYPIPGKAGTVETNRCFSRREELLFPEGDRVPVQKGGELGRFNLGSTVILLFRKGAVMFDDLRFGTKVMMGERIGRVDAVKSPRRGKRA